MTLLSGERLKTKEFFSSGSPTIHASSFDLKIGTIINQEGRKVESPFTLKPGHMVQVVSEEVFKLGNNVTAHVTYKTSMTKIGIWALTVGIVDPGWSGHISTTLLNFSKNDFALLRGDPFLRVSIFEHSAVDAESLRLSLDSEAYMLEAQRLAASKFPQTFLNSEAIAKQAGENVLERIRKEALVWVGGIALLFTIGQYASRLIPPPPSELSQLSEATKSELQKIRADIDMLKSSKKGMESP